MDRRIHYFLIASLFLLLAACAEAPQDSATTTGVPAYLTVPPEALPAPTAGPSPTPSMMKIKGKNVAIDQVIEGPLCNGAWSGTIYVSKNIQIYPWEKSPDFLRNCNLVIEPGTVVYVAHHRDTAYYNGCSCHTGTDKKP